MQKALVVVDYQNDFVDGTLGAPSLSRFYERILSLIDEYAVEGHDVIFTRDVHEDGYLETEEGRNLPVPHCLRNTRGAEFYRELEPISRGFKVIEKGTFGSLALGEFLSERGYDEITLVGLDLSICVLSNAVIAKTALPNAHVRVDLSASGSADREAERVAVQALKRIQVEVRDFREEENDG